MDTNRFGEYIKQLRKEAGLTLEELGEKTGYSNAYISMVENGKRKKPSLEFIFKLSEILNVSGNYLMSLSGLIDSEQYRNLSKLIEEEHAMSQKLAVLREKKHRKLLGEEEEKVISVSQEELHRLRKHIEEEINRNIESEMIKEIEKEEREVITYDLYSILIKNNASIYFKGRLLDHDDKEFLLDLLDRSIKEGE